MTLLENTGAGRPTLTSSSMPSLLIVDDDKAFLQRLAQAMQGRGFNVNTAETVPEALRHIHEDPPAFAVVDMKVGNRNGMEVIAELKRHRAEARAIVVTGYGNITAAVHAIKIGAIDYLAKPADADDIAAALQAPDGRRPGPPARPMSADRVRWEHIQRIHELCGRNVSETARRLRMHRRTLQRILAKRAPL